MNATYLNKNYRIVFQPKDTSACGGKRRFFVGAGRLEDYIGVNNAHQAIERAEASMEDKIRIKLRKYGIVDIYVK